MTERTEALALQAAEYAIKFTVNNPELYIPTLMEKFAELIVRECSGILRTEADSNWEGREERLLNAMADWIEQHFGVEE